MPKDVTFLVRMSQEDKRLLQALSEHVGASQASVVVIALREMARREKVRVEPATHTED